MEVSNDAMSLATTKRINGLRQLSHMDRRTLYMEECVKWFQLIMGQTDRRVLMVQPLM